MAALDGKNYFTSMISDGKKGVQNVGYDGKRVEFMAYSRFWHIINRILRAKSI